MSLGLAPRHCDSLDLSTVEGDETNLLPRLLERVEEFRIRTHGLFPFVLKIHAGHWEGICRWMTWSGGGVPLIDTDVADAGYQQRGWLFGVPVVLVP